MHQQDFDTIRRVLWARRVVRALRQTVLVVFVAVLHDVAPQAHRGPVVDFVLRCAFVAAADCAVRGALRFLYRVAWRFAVGPVKEKTTGRRDGESGASPTFTS